MLEYIEKLKLFSYPIFSSLSLDYYKFVSSHPILFVVLATHPASLRPLPSRCGLQFCMFSWICTEQGEFHFVSYMSDVTLRYITLRYVSVHGGAPHTNHNSNGNGTVSNGMAYHAKPYILGHTMVWFGYGVVWYGLVWFGLAWYGSSISSTRGSFIFSRIFVVAVSR